MTRDLGSGSETYWTWTEVTHGPSPASEGHPRHQGGLNFVYADGHVHFGRPTITSEGATYVFASYLSAKVE